MTETEAPETVINVPVADEGGGGVTPIDPLTDAKRAVAPSLLVPVATGPPQLLLEGASPVDGMVVTFRGQDSL